MGVIRRRCWLPSLSQIEVGLTLVTNTTTPVTTTVATNRTSVVVFTFTESYLRVKGPEVGFVSTGGLECSRFIYPKDDVSSNFS